MSVRCTHACSATKVPAAEFRARAFHHAQSVHKHYAAFRRTAALQLALNEQELKKLQRIQAVYRPDGLSTEEDDWLSYRHAADLDTDSQIDALGGLYFRDAGLVDLPSLCHTLLEHSRIQLIAEAKQPREQENWVIACGTSSRDFSLWRAPEIGSVWGQLELIKPTAAHLPNPIVGNGYAIPGEDAWVIGSSYEYRPGSRNRLPSTTSMLTAGLSELRTYPRCSISVLHDVFPAIATRSLGSCARTDGSAPPTDHWVPVPRPWQPPSLAVI